MEFQKLAIPDVVLVTSPVFNDERGFFRETYHREKFTAGGVALDFVQDNHSFSVFGVLRGLHYQVKHPQGKLIQAVRGTIFDVAVDLRKYSDTFGKWVGEILSEENKRQLWVPPGFAHGFLTLSQEADVVYKCTDFYAPEFERTLVWNDKKIDIRWPSLGTHILLSAKDMEGAQLEDAALFEDLL